MITPLMVLNAIARIRNVVEAAQAGRLRAMWYTDDLEQDPELLMTIANRSDESIMRAFNRWWSSAQTRYDWWTP